MTRNKIGITTTCIVGFACLLGLMLVVIVRPSVYAINPVAPVTPVGGTGGTTGTGTPTTGTGSGTGTSDSSSGTAAQQSLPTCTGTPTTPATYNPTSPCITTGGVDANGRFSCTDSNGKTQTCVQDTAANPNAPTVHNLITDYADPIINFIAGIVGLVVTIMIVVGGIQYASSADDATAVNAAKARITNAVLALLAFLFLYTFLQWITPGGFLK